MSIITITGQIGTGGNILGRKVAKSLNFKVIDRTDFEQVLKEYGIVRFEEILDSSPKFFDRFYGERHDAIDLLNKMYLIFAKMDNIVIVSRRAYIILHPFINVLNVFLKAPPSFRVQHYADRYNLDCNTEGAPDRYNVECQSIEDEVKNRETVRKKFIESFYSQRWDSFNFFSLVLDVHKIGFDLAEKFVVEGSKKLSSYDNQVGWQDGFPTIETIETDPILEKAVRKVISEANK